MLSSNDPYHPEHLLHRAGKFFRSILGVHRIIKAAYSPEYRKISVNAALVKGRVIFSVPVIQTNRISDNKM